VAATDHLPGSQLRLVFDRESEQVNSDQ
jgi:hypothetical protein